MISPNIKNSLTGSDYLTNIILYHCAPTIIGIKPASLINFSQTHQLYRLWRNYSMHQFRASLSLLNPGPNICCYEIRHQPDIQDLVLFYNPELLAASLTCQGNRQFLADLGYRPTLNTTGYLELLAQKFKTACSHEIGIFLGIPLEDVKGFIANKGKKYIFNQYWKVYQNPQTAKKIFAAYDRAKIELVENLNTAYVNCQVHLLSTLVDKFQ